ncbi:response regulator transcription factor [Methylococcus sp. EFPC2]|uniref:response regulator transcription factor n=1 Tax=Methylococcus sp. EFPC2 TaxID=2812648 RepID=UPI001966FA01|nr:response regulator transcription factor [Methylococcus sp. EFPC2]QSA97849.1 response regulator transcription factor [Methylococcus sp. EFPC2]
MTPAEPTVFLVDDDPALLKALERLLKSAGYRVAAYASAEAFLNSYDAEQAGCLLLDLAMPGMSGLDLQRWIGDTGAGLPIVFLTGHGDIPASVRAMKGGAVDFLTKPVADEVLFATIREALERDAAARLSRHERALTLCRIASLTPRELEVLEHVVAGKLNKQIAAELGTVEKTIKVHRARVMQKMQAHSLAELVRLAELAGHAPSPFTALSDA